MKTSSIATKQVDLYLTDARTITPRIGLSVVDEFRNKPGRSIGRAYNTAARREERRLRRRPEELLAQGAAVGIDGGEYVRHIRPENGITGFRGFVLGNLEGDKVLVCTRGAVGLHIPELTPEDVGKPVYSTGPNSFTLDPGAGGVEAGVIQRIVTDAALPTAVVAFKAADDRIPLAAAKPLRRKDFLGENKVQA